jgi:T5orf172 domain
MMCEVCQKPAESKYGVCQRTSECRSEYSRRWKQENPDKQRGYNRKRHGTTPKPGIVYFVAPWDDPYIKIGLAEKDRQGRLEGRIKGMQTGHPKQLYPMHTVWSEDVFRDERLIQGFFQDFRMEGGGSEWFKVPDGVDFTDWLRENWNWPADVNMINSIYTRATQFRTL